MTSSVVVLVGLVGIIFQAHGAPTVADLSQNGNTSDTAISARTMSIIMNPQAIQTFINRAGNWAVICFAAYMPCMDNLNHLVECSNQLSQYFLVGQYCDSLKQHCNAGIQTATASSDLMVRTYAMSVSNICCGTQYSISAPRDSLRCSLNGYSYGEGDVIPTYDTCSTCQCKAGNVQCFRNCPTFACQTTYYYPAGACCPVCLTTTSTTTTITPKPTQGPVCAQVPPQPRIVGGTDAGQCEFANIVGIYRYGSFLCGGSILDKNRIMTAAHCVMYGGTLQVHAGKYYLSKTTDAQLNPNLQIVNVTSYVTHPSFDSRTLVNDVAILHLATPLQFTSCVLPTCLPTTRYPNFQASCIAVGWGSLSYGGSSPQILQKVQVPAYSTQVCKLTYQAAYTATVTDGVFCAGRTEGGVDACQGDSGGILMCPDTTGSYKQFGIVSSGIGCANPGVPGLYTDVDYYLSWINAN